MIYRHHPDQEERYASIYGKIELRADEDEENREVSGLVVPYNTLSQEIWGFREKIAPGAFTKTLREDNILAVWNHDMGKVLARNKSGTLKLRSTREGLSFSFTAPDSPSGNDALASIRRGDVDEMSFAFVARRDEWTDGSGDDEDMATRTVKEAKLFEVSPVPFPAYPGTEANARADDRLAVAFRSMDAWRDENQPSRNPSAAAKRRHQISLMFAETGETYAKN